MTATDHRPDLARRLETVIAIPVTPFGADRELDAEAYGEIIGTMVSGGITAIAANGTVSEFNSLSLAEAKAMLARTVEAAGDGIDVIAGVGRDVATAIDLGLAACDAGAAALMVHQPESPYASQQGWVDYHAAIAEAVPDIGMTVYIRDPRVSAAAIAALADRCPSLVAVKYAVPDPFAFAEAVRKVGADRLAWVCGLAESWTPLFWLCGARAFTSGIANIAPAMAVEFHAALCRDDAVAVSRLWSSLNAFEQLRNRSQGQYSVSVLKEALYQLGTSGRTVRPPMSELPVEQRTEVASAIDLWSQAGVPA